MKLKSTIYGLAIGALIGGIFISCSNDLSDSYYGGAGQMRIIRAPEVTAWSGNQILGNNDFSSVNSAFGTRSQVEPRGEATQERINEGKISILTQKELDYVVAYIRKYPDGGSLECNIKAPYYIQQLGGSGDTYTLLDGKAENVNSSFQMTQLYINGYKTWWNNGAKTTQEEGDLKINLPDMSNPAYFDTYGLEPNVKYDAYRFYYIKFEENEQFPDLGELKDYIGCYIGFDYKSCKYDQGENSYDFKGDGVHNDYIIKVTPARADGQGLGEVIIPDDYDDENGNTGGDTKTTCEKCGDDLEKHDDHGVCSDCEGKYTPCSPCPNDETCEHPKGSHGEDNGYCSECNQGEDCGRPAPTNNPNKVVSHMNEVEVNFSINDLHKDANGGANYNIEDLVTKLSIHVRHAGDIEIFIPVGVQYQCAADDLYILKDHYAGNNSYGSNPVTSDIEGQTTHNLTYNVFTDAEHGEHNVTLTIQYEAGGIRVTTRGITEEIINYCKENFGDGINFEIYNYFCINHEKADGTWERITGEDGNLEIQNLYEMLNEETTIKFLEEKYPDYYINAFGYEMDKKDPNFSESQRVHDIIVKIIEEQATDYEYNGQGYHLNGTPYNDVWVKKEVTADEAHPGFVATSHQ